MPSLESQCPGRRYYGKANAEADGDLHSILTRSVVWIHLVCLWLDECMSEFIVVDEPGQMGTKLILLCLFYCGGAVAQDPRDLKAELDLAAYVRAEGDANDGLHNPLSGFIWWAWGMGLGPGSLQDPLDMGIVGHDWTTIDYGKIGFLQSTGLTPWYTPAESSPTLPVNNVITSPPSNP